MLIPILKKMKKEKKLKKKLEVRLRLRLVYDQSSVSCVPAKSLDLHGVGWVFYAYVKAKKSARKRERGKERKGES